MTSECPDRETLQNLLLGDLPASQRETLGKHLLNCDQCAATSDTIVASDDLTEAIRVRRVIEADDEILSQVIERGKQLRMESNDPPLNKTLQGDQAPSIDETYDSSVGPTRAGLNEEADFLAEPEQPDEIGRLGGYRILEIMGAGGMGIVYKAEDPKLERLVAIKAMKPAIASSRSAKGRFLREAKATAAIDHHNIVQIYQVGEDRNVPFIAMQYLQGESLQHRLAREGKLNQRDVLRIGQEVAAGLQAAHDTGLIHRDIKPDNIWIDEKTGWAKILDFGLVRSASDDAGLTHSGTVLGTPRYMAPEQAMGEEVDHRSDLFSLGSVLYHLATGRPAFSGSNLTATLIAVSQADPEDVTEVSPDLHPDLARLIMRLLSKEKADRPQSATEVAESLQAIETRLTSEPTALAAGLPTINTAPKARTARSRKQRIKRPTPKPSASGGGTGIHRKLLIGGGFAAFILLAVIVFKFTTRDGTVVVELDGPIEIASVEVDEREVSFSPDGDQQLSFQVDPGNHQLTIKTTDGLELTTDLGAKPLEIKAGGNMKLRAWVVETAVAKSEAPETNEFEWDLEYTNPIEHTPDSPLSGFSAMRQPSAVDGVLSWSVHTRHHRQSVGHVQFSPDGKLLATGSDGGTVRLWDAKTRKLKLILSASNIVRDLAFSPDGRYIAATCYEADQAQIWEVATGRLIRRYSKRHSYYGSIAWHPQGTLFATLNDREIFVWNLKNSVKAKTLKGHQAGILKFRWSPDGQWLASADDKEVLLWKTSNWTIQTRLTPARGVSVLAFSPDSQLLATSSAAYDAVIELWTVPDGELALPAMSVGRAQAIAFSPDGSKLFSVDTGSTIKCWNVANGDGTLWEVQLSAEPTVKHREYFGQKIDASPDGKYYYSIHADNSFRLYDAQSGKLIDLIGKGTGVFSPDSSLMAFRPSSHPEQIQFLELPSGKVLKTIEIRSASIASMKFSPNGKKLALTRGEADGHLLELWDVETGKQLHSIKHRNGGYEGSFGTVNWAPDGQKIAVREMWGSTIFDSNTGKYLSFLNYGANEAAGGGGDIHFYPDGETLSVLRGGHFLLYDLHDEKSRNEGAQPLPYQKRIFASSWSWSSAWSGDESIMPIIISGNHVVFYDWANDRELGTLSILANGEQHAAVFVDSSGHYQVAGKMGDEMVYTVLKTDGTQQTLTSSEFETQYGWTNDPSKVRLIDKLRQSASTPRPATVNPANKP